VVAVRWNQASLLRPGAKVKSHGAGCTILFPTTDSALMELTTLALLVLIPLLVWRIYMRLKPLFARQESLMWKHWTGAVGFPLLMVVSALATINDVLAISCLGAAARPAAGWRATHWRKRARKPRADAFSSSPTSVSAW